jgi:UDP-3-O-[3-hydroxymyristoyl] glucosamine N-acyltransferase
VATLIGNGAHAEDMRVILRREITKQYPHHKDAKLNHREVNIYIGINDPHTRAQVASELGIRDRPWMHPSTIIGGDCSWGDGTHINYGVSMTRTTIGHHCTISPGVTICGDVVIGDRVLIGAGAVICDRVRVGDDAVIGAGAVVLPETEILPGACWVGVPAKPRETVYP